MMEAESRFRVRIQPGPIGTRRFQQGVSAGNVGLDKLARTINGTIDMAFGGKVHHGVRLELGKGLLQGLPITDVDLRKSITR